MFTRKQLEKFVKTRNSSAHASNLQFQIDAQACGFKLADLGEVEKRGEGHYCWTTPVGSLTEINGEMRIGRVIMDARTGEPLKAEDVGGALA